MNRAERRRAERKAQAASKKAGSSVEQLAALWRTGDASASIRMAWDLLRAGQPGLDEKPGDARDQVRCLLAIAQLMEKETDYILAEKALRQALEVIPEAPTLLSRLAQDLNRQGRPEEAEELARRAMRLEPTDLDGATALVMVLLDEGRLTEAIAVAEQARQDNPGKVRAYLLAARVYRHAGQDTAALEALEASLKVAATGEAWMMIGHIRHDRRDGAGALAAYDKARACGHAPAEAGFARVNTLQALGRFAEARRLYRQMGEADPRFLGAHVDFLPRAGAGALESKVPAASDLDSHQMILVSCPFTFPNLPLGLGFLKAQVEKCTDFHVTCMDLNLDWYDLILDGLAVEEGTALGFKDSADFLQAATVFRVGGAAFHDPASHERLAEVFTRYRAVVQEAYGARCRQVLATNGATPWFIDWMAARILAHRPSVVGLSVMFTEQYPATALLARALKRLRPEITLIFGGGFFNKADLPGFLAQDYVDYLVLNEGEGPLPRLLDALRGKGNMAEIDGLAYQDGATGRFEVRENQLNIKHDELPYADYSDIGADRYFNPEPVIPVISSRGCYWRRCTFCDHFASYAGTYKTQSIPRVVDELQYQMQATGGRLFSFVDEMISARRFKKICEEILARGLDLRFYALAKPTPDFTPDILELMYEAGCRSIYWGLESGNDRVLSLMDKGNTVQSSSDTLKFASAAGIRNHLFMIVGFPTETEAELKDTLDFLYDHKDQVDMVLAGHYIMKRGTPTCDQHWNFGVSRVLQMRSLCNSRALRYETSEGIDAALTAPWADFLRREYLDRFCVQGRFFGTPRDHIIVSYADQDGRAVRPSKVVPDPNAVWRVLHKQAGSSRDDGQAPLYPVWRF
ncbi:hypothetical protein JCM17960_23900 [Magnetospira thiophila]